MKSDVNAMNDFTADDEKLFQCLLWHEIEYGVILKPSFRDDYWYMWC